MTSEQAVIELAALLSRAIALLEAHGETSWATWLRADRERIVHGEAARLGHLLSAFGGMGSLNDVVFSPANGNAADERSGVADTEQLRELLNELYVTARDLNRR